LLSLVCCLTHGSMNPPLLPRMAKRCTCSVHHTELAENPDISGMNECVLKAAGLDVHLPAIPAAPGLAKRSAARVKEVKGSKKELVPPKVDPVTTTDGAIQQLTGFVSMFALLAFILVVCNGDVDVMLESCTELTWFEEWVLYFQCMWGRQNITEESLAFWYGISRRTAMRVLERKRSMVLAARERWPMFASYEECIQLQAESWKKNYGNKRLIMWDDTNIDAPGPSDAAMNRHLYSQYYNGCVGKGGVFLQTCGWIGVWMLWAGAVSDSDYMTTGGILEVMQLFVAECALHSDIPFTLILDKGYRIVLDALHSGGQMTVQPNFAKSDRKFNSEEVLRSAAIATDRSANERGVRVCKHSGLLKRGLQHHQSTAAIDDAWCAWSFQVNFMFKPVLKVNY